MSVPLCIIVRLWLHSTLWEIRRNFTSIKKWTNWVLVHLTTILKSNSLNIISCFCCKVFYGLYSLNRCVYTAVISVVCVHFLICTEMNLHTATDDMLALCLHFPVPPPLNFKWCDWLTEVWAELHKLLVTLVGLCVSVELIETLLYSRFSCFICNF